MNTHADCQLCSPGRTIRDENELCWFLQEPQAVLKGSGLIVPKRHCRDAFELTPAEWSATYDLLVLVRARLQRELEPHGFNLGWNCGATAGQEIFHAHLHVIPRFSDEPLAGKGIRHWLKQPDTLRPSLL